MVQLSHDQTLDMAFTRTIGRDGVLAAVAPVIARERVSRRAEAVAGVLREADAGRPLPELVPSPEMSLADRFEQVALFGDFGMETRASSELARLEREAAPLIEGAEARRHLQARIFADGTSLDRLRAGTAHRIDVRIGARSLDWLSLARPFPGDELPMLGSNRLTVVLTEPHLLDTPVVREVVLPPRGDSTVATFSLTTATDTTTVDARLIVLHRNRVLQTARLPSEVDQAGAEPSGGGVAVAAPETFVAPATGDMAARRSFDVAFLVNKSADGESRVTHVHGDSAGIVRLDGKTLDGTVKKISRRLGEIVDSPDDFGGLDQEASVLTANTGLDLLVVTHIDADHISGVLAVVEDDSVAPAPEDLWFNGWRHLPADILGGGQGERLTAALKRRKLPWNKAFHGKAVCVPDDEDAPLPVVTLPGGLRLTVLSPTRAGLAALRPKWAAEVRKAGMVPDPVAVARIITRRKPVRLEFNYRAATTELWSSASMRQEFRYAVVCPVAGGQSSTVEL